MKSLARICALVCACQLGVSLPAQVANDTSTETTVAADGKIMADALKLRSDLASAVVSGDIKPEAAIEQLRAAVSPSDLKIDPDAGFAFAAIDVGQRLVAAGKPIEAEKFFLQAEASLDQLVKRTPDTQAKDKAMFLRKLSLIRGNFLNKRNQAKADIDRALTLQPEDKSLQKARDLLAGASGQELRTNPKG